MTKNVFKGIFYAAVIAYLPIVYYVSTVMPFQSNMIVPTRNALFVMLFLETFTGYTALVDFGCLIFRLIDKAEYSKPIKTINIMRLVLAVILIIITMMDALTRIICFPLGFIMVLLWIISAIARRAWRRFDSSILITTLIALGAIAIILYSAIAIKNDMDNAAAERRREFSSFSNSCRVEDFTIKEITLEENNGNFNYFVDNTDDMSSQDTICSYITSPTAYGTPQTMPIPTRSSTTHISRPGTQFHYTDSPTT